MAWQFWRRDAAQNTSGNSSASSNRAQPAAQLDEDKLRTVARRRLIGAAVLVALTVLIFPWVFKQQPRPINDDLIIEVPRKEAAKPWASAGAAPVAPAAPASAAVEPAAKPAAVQAPAEEPKTPPKATEADAKPAAAAIAAGAAVAAAAVAKPSKPAKPEPKPAAAKPETKPEVKPEAKVEAKPEAAAQTGRFVVQVAAFSDANKVRETRVKLEAQGYKTYSQAIDSPKGKVWRVRVGPFDNKAEAEKAKAQLAGKGFAPALLEL